MDTSPRLPPSGPEAGNVRREATAAILAAAERVFSRGGFDGARMADIAAEAGLPKANLHYYFGTKERLYAAVLEDIVTQWLDAAAPSWPTRAPAPAHRAFSPPNCCAARRW
jgi:TetR/AcrR family transcriptional regulator